MALLGDRLLAQPVSKQSVKGCLKFGGLIESKEVEAERESVEGAGGGVIALISGDGVTNNGSTECRTSDSAHFSGGTIMISTDGRFQNNGVIDCGPGGVVLIDCAEFVDKGAITPSPMVVVRKEKAAMPWIQSMTSKLTEKRMKLKVESHRGHSNYGDYSFIEFEKYPWRVNGADGDWIIFSFYDGVYGMGIQINGIGSIFVYYDEYVHAHYSINHSQF